MKKELLTRRSWTLILLSLLLSWSCLSVANAQSIGEKKVTMDLKGASVKTFFYVMEKQTGLNFICSADLVKSLPAVVVKVNKKPALEVLDMVMASLNCKYVINGTLVTVTRYEREVQNRN
jgi:type II secretory pathway component GspD/PulD (secretin)